jgi:hypothetical protein
MAEPGSPANSPREWLWYKNGRGNPETKNEPLKLERVSDRARGRCQQSEVSDSKLAQVRCSLFSGSGSFSGAAESLR